LQLALEERDAVLTEIRAAMEEREQHLLTVVTLRDQLQQAAEVRDQIVAELRTTVQARERVLTGMVTDRDRLQQTLVLRDEALAELHATLAERERALAQAVAQREGLQQFLELRDQAIAEMQATRETYQRASGDMQAALGARERDLQKVAAERDRLQEIVTLRDGAIADLRSELENERERGVPRFAEDLAIVRARQTQIAATTEHIQSLLTQSPQPGVPAAIKLDSNAEHALAIHRKLLDGSGLRAARATLQEHFADPSDHNFADILGLYDEALARALPYWDIRTAVRVLASVIQPQTYLEVGTRRGWSLAQVFAEVPEVRAFVFELWVKDYGEARQGDPRSIRAAMQRVIGRHRRPQIEFINGSSHETLPAFFAGDPNFIGNPPPQEIDLIAVDGDHSLLGAWWDLLDLMPRVALGGALVFDDLEYAGDDDARVAMSKHNRPPLPSHLGTLADVWDYTKTLYPNFLFFDTTRQRFRAGIALRIG
jgi:hypothetical protein